MSDAKAIQETSRLLENGAPESACMAAEEGLTAFPSSAQLWFLLGAARHSAGDRPGALAAFQEARHLSGDVPAILNPIATLLVEEGRLDDALVVLDLAAAIAPNDTSVCLNRGVVLERLRRLEEALLSYDRAIRAAPAFFPALLNRGALLTVLGRYEEAVSNNRKLVMQFPQSADARFNLAEALLAVGHGLEALQASDDALRIDPVHVRARIDRGLALADLGRFGEAQREFEKTEAIRPGSVRDYLEHIAPSDPSVVREIDPRLFFFYRSGERLLRCDWSTYEQYIEELRAFVGSNDPNTLRKIDLPLAYQALTVPLPPELPQRVARIIGNRYAEVAGALQVRFEHSPRSGRIRLGYLSADFREHLNARLSHPLFRMHDRSRFEVFAYSIGPDDQAEIRAKIASSADTFVDLRQCSDIDSARRIYADGIDVLIDFGGYTEYCRPGIGALRPAPVQVAHIGFPGTMGAPWIDYRLTDAVATPPEQEKFWTEHLLFMPESFFLYDGEQPIPDEPVSRAEYGLPEDAFVFCAHHNGYKIEPMIFGAWVDLLKAVPRSVLWVSARHPAIGGNLARQVQASGLDPARLVVSPLESRSRYLSRFRLADLFLDTHQFSAATTACDVLWMGLPLLAFRGEGFPSRQSTSILTALGLPDMSTDSLEEYRDRALVLARNPAMLDAVRKRLNRGRIESSMFRPGAYVHHFERAIEAIMESWRNGLPHRRTTIQPSGAVTRG